MQSIRRLVSVLVSAVLLARAGVSAHAQKSYLYGTTLDHNNQAELFRLDVTTGAYSALFSPGGSPDGLTIDRSGRLIYSTTPAAGEVHAFDPLLAQQLAAQYEADGEDHAQALRDGALDADSILARVGGTALDVALTPDGGSVLVSNQRNSGGIDRVYLDSSDTAQHWNSLTGADRRTDGLAYVASRLFANIGTRDATKQIAELDPSTGAVIRYASVSSGPGSMDGLTYDARAGKLYAAVQPQSIAAGTGIYEIDPTTLVSTFISLSDVGALDGIVSDGNGHLFLAGIDRHRIFRYDVFGGTLSTLRDGLGNELDVGQVDDLAWGIDNSVSGSAPIPEGSSLVMFAMGGVTLVGAARLAVRRRIAD